MTARRPSVGLLCVLVGLLPVLAIIGTQTQVSAAGEDMPTPVTKPGSGHFSSLEVSVSQTQHLRNQVVEVSWTGGTPTFFAGPRSAANYLQIMQCWGDGDAPKRENCQFGGWVDDQLGGDWTAERQVSYPFKDEQETLEKPAPGKQAIVPFEPVSGEPTTSPKNEYYDSYSTNEIPYGRTSANGTGREFFEVQTLREAPGLGCGARLDTGPRACWLVVVPRDNLEVTGEDFADRPEKRLQSSPLSASNFANAIAFKLEFEPVGVACPIGSAERRLLGHELVSEAVSRWQPALCNSTGSIFGFSVLGDDLARKQVLTPQPWLSIVSDPMSPKEITDGRRLTYAPLAVSGIGIAFNIERRPSNDAPEDVKKQRGTRVLSLNLNARLVAKLLTQSYVGAVPGDAPYLAGNPDNLTKDPEFLELNPEFKNMTFIGRLSEIINPLGLADANQKLWQWIGADSDATAFVNGKADPWGMKVNRFYLRLKFDRADYPRADPTCQTYPYSPSGQTPLCSLETLTYAADFAAAARGTSRGQTLATATWDESANPPRYKVNKPQLAGERAVLAIVDTASAGRYRLPLASLQNAAGAFVAPTTASIRAALLAMEEFRDTGVLVLDPTERVKAAYPLAQVSYALTAPSLLTEDEAKDYAAFVRYATGPGQVPGIGPGQLPEGYAPLTPKLREQALSAARDIAQRRGPDAPEPEEPPKEPEVPPVTSAPVDPSEVAPVPATPESPPLAAPPVVIEPVAAVEATATPNVAANSTRFALVAALMLGVLALLARLLIPLIHRHTSRMSAGP